MSNTIQDPADRPMSSNPWFEPADPKVSHAPQASDVQRQLDESGGKITTTANKAAGRKVGDGGRVEDRQKKVSDEKEVRADDDEEEGDGRDAEKKGEKGGKGEKGENC